MSLLGLAEAATLEASSEVHAISIYKAKYGQVDVHVSVTGHPVILLLSAYDAVEWVIHTDPNVIIERVVVSGYYGPVVKGISKTVPVHTLPKDDRLETYWIDNSWQGGFGVTYRNVIAKTKTYLGKTVKTFQGDYKTDAFIIDGQRSLLYPPSLLKNLEQTISEAPAFESGAFAPSSDMKAGNRHSYLWDVEQTDVYPATIGTGSIDNSTIGKYQAVVVLPFAEPANAKGAGVSVASFLMGQLNAKGFRVIDPLQLDVVSSEQHPQEKPDAAHSATLLKARRVGANAVVVGEIHQWTELGQMIIRESPLTISPMGYVGTEVSVSLRVLDVETGAVLFAGNGSFPRPTKISAQRAAQMIVRAIVTRLAIRTGLLSMGRAGFSWTMQAGDSHSEFRVSEFEADSLAWTAGLRGGDGILACNQKSSTEWKTQWDSMRACQAEAGQALKIEVMRNGERLTFSIRVADRFIRVSSPHQIP
jgi:hypothetical protein